ncbi:hypothetical protein GCM10009650_05600 [Nesterenkonia jeotgali]
MGFSPRRMGLSIQAAPSFWDPLMTLVVSQGQVLACEFHRSEPGRRPEAMLRIHITSGI